MKRVTWGSNACLLSNPFVIYLLAEIFSQKYCFGFLFWGF